jgi:hypothetical protein
MKKVFFIFLFLVFLFSCQKKECWECKVFFYEGQITVDKFTHMDVVIMVDQDSTTRNFCDVTEHQINRYMKDVNKGATPISACGRLRWTTCDCYRI